MAPFFRAGLPDFAGFLCPLGAAFRAPFWPV